MPIFWSLGDKRLYPPKTKDLKELYPILEYNEGYEPFVVIHRSAPGWRERFIGFGINRQSHVINYLIPILIDR